jgi:hypothetical protein
MNLKQHSKILWLKSLIPIGLPVEPLLPIGSSQPQVGSYALSPLFCTG